MPTDLEARSTLPCLRHRDRDTAPALPAHDRSQAASRLGGCPASSVTAGHRRDLPLCYCQRDIRLASAAELEAVVLTRDRRDRLDQAITQMATNSEYTAVVRRLGCLRGISLLTAFGLAVEIGDWHRFTGAMIGAYLGLVPTESSSGQQRSQGSITKAGNAHARRLLVEAAWHHRRDYRNPGATMLARDKLDPPVHHVP